MPAVIERVAIPLEFRRVQAADLSGWRGDAHHPELLTLLQSIRDHLEARGMDAESVPREPEHSPGIWGPTNRRRARTRSHLALLAGLVGVLTLGTFVTVRLLTAPSSVPVAKDRRQIESPSQKPSIARDVPRSSSGLAAPAPLEPACGSVIPFDRPMMLSWRSVEGASTYTVEVDCLGCGGPQSGWSSQAGVPWHIREQLGLRSPIYNAADLLSRLRQSGGRALRWRVWALGHDGQEGEKSAWCQIAFKGDPRRPTP